MSLFNQQLPFDFPTTKKLDVKFSSIDLSSDGGLLMVRQAEENIKICQGFAECLEEKRERHKIKHSLIQLVSQRVYQIIGGYFVMPMIVIICVMTQFYSLFVEKHQQLKENH